MYAVVINPISGNGKGALLGTAVVGRLRNLGVDYVLVSATNAQTLTQNLQTLVDTTNIDGIIAVGGDGLVHLVLQVAAPNMIPFTVVPAGTGNDFARSLNTDYLTVEEVLALSLETRARPIDLGLVDSEYFGAVLSTGFDSVVNERANVLKWPKGPARYNAAMILELPKFSPISYDITADGKTFTTEAMLIAIGNGASYGGGMKVCPDADLRDGLFDVMILRPVSKIEFLRIFPTVYSGSHVNHRQVEIFRAKSVAINSVATAYADGERVGQLPVKAECISNAALAWSL